MVKGFHMARQPHRHETTPQPWGTLEELLLACAVNRHGTKSWDSIVMEVQNRTSSLPSLTSQNCKDKFNDLKRRFMSPNDTPSIVDQLRKIRVEELRREVQQRDISIVSLEQKVKRLEEERERSLREEADLISTKNISPNIIVGKSDGGNDSGDERDNRSFNESNSTGQKEEMPTIMPGNGDVEKENVKEKTGLENDKDPVQLGSDPADEHNWSHNNESNKIISKTTVKKEVDTKLSQTTGGESNEVGESVVESKREENGKDKDKEKQNNSDVQSSVSLSQHKKKRRRRGGSHGGGGEGDRKVGRSSGDEPEGGDEVSPATKKFEPLVKLISIIRSHRLGSTFERRLRSQESERYKKLIRQHMDLQTIQSRLDKGVYSSCMRKFFRDLFLLFNNAIVFFKKSSPENLAACELRAIVRKEMTEKLRIPTKPEPVIVKSESKMQQASFSKPDKCSSTMIACRKANSTKALPRNATKKDNKKDEVVEEKPRVEDKSAFVKIEEKGIRKKRTMDRSAASNKNTAGNRNREVKHQYGGNELSSHDALEMKVERKGSITRKKQGAASFLKRMKQNSPGEETENDDDEEEEENDSSEQSKDSKVKVEKGRRRGNNRTAITDRVMRSSRGRGARGESGRGKRVIGRPTKKQAETAESGGGTAKRGRENGNSQVGSGGGRARKRPRR